MIFQSISALGEYLRDTPRAEGAGYESLTIVLEDTNFFSYQEALDSAICGGIWAKGAENLKSVNVNLPQTLQQDKKISVGMEGFTPLVPHSVMNLPDNMLTICRKTAKKPIIRVAVNAGLSISITEEQALNRGRAILSVVESLELSGVQVELWAMNKAKDQNNRDKEPVFMRTCIKQINEQAQYTALSFALCSLFWTRRLAFRFMECHKKFNGMTTHTYGVPFDEKPEGFDVLIPSAFRDKEQFNNYQSALSCITKTFNEQVTK